MATVDVLMITHRRPAYTKLSLARLLETCDDSMRVWLWHNGSDPETLEFVTAMSSHPRVVAFHHSDENVGLERPTNWLWQHARGDYVAKVDDDCLVEPGWAQRLREAHDANPSFGVIGSWRFYDEDFAPRLARRKIRTFGDGHQLMVNCWVQGSGYLMKRRCIEEQGLLEPGQNFTQYCIDLSVRGFVNGWYYPFIHEEHMDDPRSPYTMLRTDDDLRRHPPLSAAARQVTSLRSWESRMRRSALLLQASPTNPKNYIGWRGRTHWRIRRLFAKT